MAKNKFPVWAIILLSVVGLALLIGLWIGGTYNSFVGLDEGVNNAWGKVQSAYQRRADLIPNLVATVKASSEFESEMQTKIAELRSGIDKAKTPAELDTVNAQITNLFDVTVEAYPEIKSTEAYRDLLADISGTENRIKVERDGYNDAVREFNTKARRFPSNIVAGMFGFSQKEYFESNEGAENAPDVGSLFE